MADSERGGGGDRGSLSVGDSCMGLKLDMVELGDTDRGFSVVRDIIPHGVSTFKGPKSGINPPAVVWGTVGKRGNRDGMGLWKEKGATGKGALSGSTIILQV